MSMSKLTTLNHLKMALTRTAAEDAKLSGKIEGLITDVEGLIAAKGEENVLEGAKVNGNILPITDKMIDILIAAGEENGTLSVNGAAVAITGLQALAYKANISESDLDEALKASIAAKATNADLSALEVRVTTVEGKVQTLENAGFQNAEQVAAAIQDAIAGANHLKYEIVDAAPTAENADANTWYMVLNAETGHYDIYGLLNGEVRLIDDTTIDLTGYSTTAAMEAFVTQQIAALNVDQYSTDEELAAAVARITDLETTLGNVYTKEEAEAKFTDETEAQAIAENAVAAATATDDEVDAVLDEAYPEDTSV